MAASQKILSSHWYSQCLFCSFIHYSHQCYLLSSILIFRLSSEAPVLCFLVVLLTVIYRLFGTWKKTIITGNINKHVSLQCGLEIRGFQFHFVSVTDYTKYRLHCTALQRSSCFIFRWDVGREINYPYRRFPWFSCMPLGNRWQITYRSPWPLPLPFFPNRSSWRFSPLLNEEKLP